MTNSSETSRRRPVIIFLIGLAWLIVIAGAIIAGSMSGSFAQRDPVLIAGLVAQLVVQIAAPLAVVVIGIDLLRRSARRDLDELEARSAAAGAATAAIREGLFDIDATLAAVLTRVEGLRAAATGDGGGLVLAATRLEAGAAALQLASNTASGASQQIGTLLPEASRQATSLATILERTASETGRQLETVETMLAGVWSRNDAAAAQVTEASATMAGLLAGIENASVAAAGAIADRTATLGRTVDTALDRATAALDATRDGIHVQTDALLASVDQARVALDAIGGEAAQRVTARLTAIIDVSDTLAARLADHDAGSQAMVEGIERSFAILDKRLGHAAAMGTATLDGFQTRMAAIRDTADSVNPPLVQANAALDDAHAGIARLTGGADGVIATLAEHLPVHAEAVAALTSDLDQLNTATTALVPPVDAAAAAIAAAGAEVARQQAVVEKAAHGLTAELGTAQATLAAIEGVAQGSALTSAQALIEVLSRVREVANATAGTMRTTLDAIVAEAEAALDNAGTARAKAAFGDPIRAEIAGLDGAATQAGLAAQATADRIAARLMGLTATVATVEARIDEVDTRYDLRLRDDIAKRSASLLDSLRAQAIDIARPMAIEVRDGDWAAYLKGDRGLFARRAVRLIDGGTARAIARHFQHDPVFAEQATRYIGEFETLLDRVRADREGQALAVTLVSSDVGKLYVVLAQALERLK
ncbi:hypothetical protein KZX46_14580 [Polymorphobacter sp. PAMC 29334]|uniref:hypothetical protein n=1 Tax=Polymorphobacter sp. PAMC 29334 TaxID=2862331 RepID=UPI001C74A1A3|nr:hypothetical protein [Polymorphobacter sp. PAMC 29334]QYE34028.1 hypothetical protein KZX46_14580 [Polymorphobacter sp. PAMC 29334]